MALRNPNLYTPEQKESPLNQIITPKAVLKFVFCLIILFALAYLLLFSKYFRVTEVITKSQNNLDQNKVKQIVMNHLTGYQNIFLLNSAQTESDLKNQFDNIEDIKIYRGLPHTIQVVFLERQPALIWHTQDKYFLVDRSGVAYRETSANSNFPLVSDEKNISVEINQQLLSADFVSFVSNLGPKLKSKANVDIESISIQDSILEIHVKTKAGYTVYFAADRSLDDQLDALNQSLKVIGNTPITYIDVRVPGRAYYK